MFRSSSWELPALLASGGWIMDLSPGLISWTPSDGPCGKGALAPQPAKTRINGAARHKFRSGFNLFMTFLLFSRKNSRH